MQLKSIASKIEHILLTSNIGLSNIDKHCNEAMEYKFHSICIFSSWLKEAKNILKGTNINLTTVVDFSKGISPCKSKLNKWSIVLIMVQMK